MIQDTIVLRRIAVVKTILVVEDEPRLRKIIADFLTVQGYRVVEAGEGIAAVKKFDLERPDMIILDILIPGKDGFAVAKEIRGRSSVPIIMLTAKGEESDRVHGLNIGSDDYIVKPFSLQELEARIRAVFRRYSGEKEDLQVKSVTYKGFTLDSNRRTIEHDGKTRTLTATQFAILELFLEHPDRVFTREEILQHAFQHPFEHLERTVDAHIKNLRKIIEPDPANPRYLQTVWGVGYVFS